MTSPCDNSSNDTYNSKQNNQYNQGKSLYNKTLNSEINTTQDELKLSSKDLFIDYIIRYKKHYFYAIVALAIVDLMDILPPIIVKSAIDVLQKNKEYKFLVILCLVYLISAIIQAIFRFYWRKYFLGTSHQIAYDLRRQVYEHIQNLSFTYFCKTKTGELMSRLTNDIDQIRMMYGIGLLLIIDALFYLISVPFILLWLSYKLALFILVPLPLVPLFVSKVGAYIYKYSEIAQAKVAELSAFVQENFSGIRIIKGFVREDIQLEYFDRQSNNLVDAKLKLSKIESGFYPALEFIVGIGTFLLLLLGGYYVINNEVSLGTFIAFQSYLTKMVWPMTAIGMTINMYQTGMASMARTAEVLNEVSEHETHVNKISIKPVCQFEKSLEVRNLSFNYSNNERFDSNKSILNLHKKELVNDTEHQLINPITTVLNNVSFKLTKGKILGITGPIGSGKSTLLYLIMRLLDPPPQTIFLDGVDIRTYDLISYRSLFGYVPQDSFLFSDTILENIIFGIDRSKSNKSKEKIYEIVENCAKIAQIHDEIMQFHKNYEAMLGERGINLSGGQRQRITLARALAKDPQILIIDDATSAIDTDTEERLLACLKSYLKNKTAIIVSHRLVSISFADEIIYLENGRVLESGIHEDLIRMNGKYAKLWQQQQIKREIEVNN